MQHASGDWPQPTASGDEGPQPPAEDARHLPPWPDINSPGRRRPCPALRVRSDRVRTLSAKTRIELPKRWSVGRGPSVDSTRLIGRGRGHVLLRCPDPKVPPEPELKLDYLSAQ
ncbi:hypothetical protein GCM10010270_38060 [Streptomyces violaceus]|nr:hypothetical protein GCM10010270_38060 [Streptomyces janthinus]